MVLYLLGLSWYGYRFVADISFGYKWMFEQLVFQGRIIRKLYVDTYTRIYFPPWSIFDFILEEASDIYLYFVLYGFCTEQLISKVVSTTPLIAG